MKLTIDRNALMRALSHVQAVVERRNTIPILSNILMVAEGDKLSLTATDLDIEATDAAPAEIKKAGSVTAPAQTLFDVVRKLPEGAEVTLDLADSRLSISSGRARFALPTLPAADFQTMAKEAAPIKFEIEAAELRRLIDKTRFAISTEETRYYLNGIYLHHAKGAKGPVLRTVATDGHRLALAETVAPKGSAALKGVIVPRKAVAEIRRLLDDAPETVTVEASDSKITVHIGEAVLTSKLIDGSFPDYQRVIPKDNNRILTLDNKDFKQAVRSRGHRVGRAVALAETGDCPGASHHHGHPFRKRAGHRGAGSQLRQRSDGNRLQRQIPARRRRPDRSRRSPHRARRRLFTGPDHRQQGRRHAIRTDAAACVTPCPPPPQAGGGGLRRSRKTEGAGRIAAGCLRP